MYWVTSANDLAKRSLAEMRESMGPRWGEDLARRLLAQAPILVHAVALGDPWPTGAEDLDRAAQMGSTGVIGSIWRLIDGCLAGDESAMVDTKKILQAVPNNPVLDPVADAAAWHSILSDRRAGHAPYLELWHSAVDLPLKPYNLFTDMIDKYPPAEDSPLRGADVLACQHLLGSIIPQFQALRDLLPTARFWEVLGKPYSAHVGTVETLEAEGFAVNRESCGLPTRGPSPDDYELGSFAQRHRRIVRASVQRYFESMPSPLAKSRLPILVLDDGGALIDAVGHEAVKRQIIRPIVCIEQTQHGLYAARTYTGRRHVPSGGFAVVNVAQSLSKLVLESPLIAESVVDNIISAIDRLSKDGVLGGSSLLPIGLMGFGSVGESIADSFRSQRTQDRLLSQGLSSQITIYDRNKNRIASAKRQGYEIAWSADHLLSQSHLVIAATGGTSVDEKRAMCLPEKAILTSASSGDLEFGGLSSWKFTQAPVLPGLANGAVFDRVHGDIRAQRPAGGEVNIINAGFPVNFNGALDPIPVDQIQLTRSLMLAGVVQAIGYSVSQESLVGQTGVHGLDSNLDRFLGEAFQALGF